MVNLPGFDEHPVIELDDLLRLEDPCVLYEGLHIDSDGLRSYVYSVGGWLNGRSITEPDHMTHTVKGALVGGDAIIVQAKDRAEADAMAADGLMHTIDLHRARGARAAQLTAVLTQGISLVTERRPRKQ